MLWRCVVVAVFLAGRAVSVPAQPAAPHFRIVEVGPGCFAAVATPGDRASVGNAGFVVGSGGILVVDAFATEEASRDLLVEIRGRSSLPIRWVVNTHYHLDHVGGDAVFRREGAVIVAHENVRRWIRTENLKWRREITPKDRAELDALPLPEVTSSEVTLSSGITLALGGRDARALFRPGHTGGDLIVRVDGSDVVFGGDLFWNATVPNLIDADTAAWVSTLDGFTAEYPSAAYVPGHGEPGRALQVRFFRDYLAGLRQATSRAMESGLSGPSLAAAGLDALRPRYGAWTWFDQFAASNLEQTEREMRGTKKYAK
ncbi:MAG: MBL fold metallo-hydrolase [Acidobacteria bacterium]|nr:MBL fold metallo-hydrolase [Acidobacteriota bacterium]